MNQDTTPHPTDALPLPEPFMVMCRDTVPHIYDAWANQLRAARREGFELAIRQAQPTPALKRHALEAADQLSKYAAAPFFPDTDKRGVTRSTTTEWWDGLAELIEEAQPLIARALRECTEPRDEQQQAGAAEASDEQIEKLARQFSGEPSCSGAWGSTFEFEPVELRNFVGAILALKATAGGVA